MPGRNFLRFAAHRTGNCLPKRFAVAELAGASRSTLHPVSQSTPGLFGTRRAVVDLDPAIPADIAGPHGTPTPATAMPVAHELPDEGRGCLIPVSAPEREQSEMPNVTFFSEVPAARRPSSDDSAETEQSDWLKERSTLPEGRFQRTSDGLCPSESSPRKGTVSDTRTEFHQGSRQDEQNPSLAASGREAPRWPGYGRYGETLLLKGR